MDEINVFLIAPAKYQVVTTSPHWKYLRMLEAGAWRQYLGGAAYRSLHKAMVVYYWRHRPEGPTAKTVIQQPRTGTPVGRGTGPVSESGINSQPAPTGTRGSGDNAGTIDAPTRGAEAGQDASAAAGADVGLSGNSVRTVGELPHSVNPDNPFRVFADFNAPGIGSWWQEFARLAAAIAVLVAAVHLTSGGFDIAHLPLRKVPGLLTAATLIGIIALGELLHRVVARGFLGPREWFRKVERRIIGKR